MKIDENDIKNVLNSLMDGFDRENLELYEKVMENQNLKRNVSDPEEFYFFLMYPYEKFLRGLITKEVSDNDNVIFILLNYNFIDRHFNNLFEKYEGSFGCADKSRTMIKHLIKFYKGDIQKIEFDYEQKYTYHLPQTIFLNHDEIINFYEALVSLKMGNGDKYVEIMNQISTQYG